MRPALIAKASGNLCLRHARTDRIGQRRRLPAIDVQQVCQRSACSGTEGVSRAVCGVPGHARGEVFGRIHHLPAATLAAVANRMRDRGFIDDAGRITGTGREIRERIEARTDELAAPPYDILTSAELDHLITELEPLAAALAATGSG